MFQTEVVEIKWVHILCSVQFFIKSYDFRDN
jgi:hypothetical protein